MRLVKADEIGDVVSRLYEDANFNLPEDVLSAMEKALEIEKSPQGKAVLKVLLENAKIASKEKLPLCQDCGTAVVFIEIGHDTKIEGDIIAEVNRGVREAVQRSYLRRSMCDPLTRKNTGDGTPAIVHINFIPGEKIRIIVAPKGGGSENASALTMLTPAEGRNGIVKFVLDTVKAKASGACPPIIVGVGIGGNYETCAFLAKRALLSPIGERSKNPVAKELEEELLEKINATGIGPQGLGGEILALDVKVNIMPCHIASLPVAVNIQCNSARHKEAEI